MKKIVCLLLALLLATNLLIASAGSLSVYFEYHKPLTPSLDYTSYKATDSSSKPQSIHVLDFKPGRETLPLVAFGKSLKSHNTVFSMLKEAREGGLNAVAGVNADFYSFYTGIPLSAVIADGRVLSSDAGNNAIGFYADGGVIVGCPDIKFTLSFVPVIPEKPANELPNDNENVSDDLIADENENPTDEVTSDEVNDTSASDTPTALETDIPTEAPAEEEHETASEGEVTDTTVEEEANESENTEEPPADMPIDTEEDPSLVVPEDPTDVVVEDNRVSFDAYFNKYPTVYAAYLMDSSYSESTSSDFECTEYVLIPSSEARIGETLILTVESIIKGEKNAKIPKDRYVLTIPDAINKNGELEGIVEGAEFTLEITSSEGWGDVVCAVGGGDVIVSDGAFVPESVDESHEKLKNARTAVGVRADGTVFFVAVDGDGVTGSGMTYSHLAEFMISNGAQTVLNLDGGGSTTVAVAFPSDDEVMLMNVPKDGASRRVSNAMLFVNSSENDDTLGFVEIASPSSYILGGVALELSPVIYTAFGEIAELDSDTAEIESTYTLSEPDARVENGIYVSADKTYTERLFGLHKIGDVSLESYSVINVVDTVDSLTLNEKHLMVSEGDTFALFVNAEKNEIPVIAPLHMLSFGVKEETDDNTPESDVEPSDGTESVTESEALPDTTESDSVDAVPEEAEDTSVPEEADTPDGDEMSEEEIITSSELLFENEFITVSNEGLVTVKSAPLFTSFDLTVSYKDVGSVLSVYFGKALEELDSFEYTSFDTFAHPASIIAKEGYRSEKAVQVLDGNLSYKTPIKLDICPESFLIYMKDSSQKELYTVISHNGKVEMLPYGIYKDYSKVSGWVTLIAPIPEEIKGEIEVLCPILSKESREFTVDGFTASYGLRRDPFEDIDGIWSHDYIVEIFDMGLINGYVEDDVVIFKPEKNITRAEFAKMLASYLSLDMSAYSDYGAEFADREAIAEWAASYIMALSNEGYMNGRSNPDGTLTFDSDDFITRQEAMHVFAKLLEISGEIAELEFSDPETVQEWALESVKKVVSAGIVTGFDDGTIRAGDPVTRAQMCTMFTRLWNARLGG